jgi:hypothetical protein
VRATLTSPSIWNQICIVMYSFHVGLFWNWAKQARSIWSRFSANLCLKRAQIEQIQPFQIWCGGLGLYCRPKLSSLLLTESSDIVVAFIRFYKGNYFEEGRHDQREKDRLITANPTFRTLEVLRNWLYRQA